MNARTVDWTALRGREEEPAAEGLRERKKRLLRQQLSDTATEMFMDRGFDAVRVSEIADACGVSEKTVFNYFPTKESLVLDLGDTTLNSLRTTLADPDLSPVEAVLEILSGQLTGLTSWLAAQDDWTQATAVLRRFGMLIGSTPSLRAYQRDMTDQQIAVAAEVLAQRTEMNPDDPEPQIAAAALLALWPIQFRALRRHLNRAQTPEELREKVSADVHRAAQLIDTGLISLAPAPARPRPRSGASEKP
ncbi:DNA-binding transcriptional regulator, AcrR family [Streptomyces sp. 3213]|uniref:TetR family transcriptional regulator n=1 Tax=Streptomyces sp. 3213.3 TaxID=1855348 RepID=UPI00089AE515|nr:TetR family transcriptional regulator [Streptomyces sp. 3213.3]SEC52508.1 DNA-binding transcriptional regulator, AcrR family [Streptomyces sp. 3213] [Streptomyces sp. 3213.3]